MMKNKKLIVVFILIVAFLLLMVTCTKASDDIGELPTIVTDPNTENTQASSNNEENNEVLDDNTINNTVNTNISSNTNTNVGNNNTLPQTGVQGDTALFIFIGICIVSAIYAYFKIRKYNNVH